MSRPNLVVVWQATGNFPPGPDPWATRPLAVQPAGTFFTPNTKPAAEDFNWLFGNLVNDVASVFQQVGQTAGQNWHQPLIVSRLGGAAWDAVNGRWFFGLVGVDGGGGQGISLNYTQNTENSSLALQYGNAISTSANLQIQSILVGAGSGFYLVGVVNFNTGVGTVYSINGTSFPNYVVSLGSITATDIQLDRFVNYLIFAGDSTPTAATVSYSATGLASSWTTATIPASLQSVVKWRTAKSATAIVAFDKGNTAQTKYMRSTDGVAWTERTIALAAGASVQGVAYGLGPFGAAFIVAATNSGGTGLDTWISYDDGLTFSLISSVTSINAWDIAALGSLWVIIDQHADPTVGSEYASRFAMSVDGGLTWRWVLNDIRSGVAYTNRYGVDSRIYAGDTDFYAANSTNQTISLNQGVPPTALT